MAAAIKYDKGDRAPRLTAFGEGEIAEKIIELAVREGVPLYQEEDLVLKLKQLEIGREIPPELYQVVARVLSFVYYLDQKKGEEIYGQ